MLCCASESTLVRVGDLSALIFVALAVAWGAYLIPKAVRHHSEAEGSRSIDAFSDRVRVLASREPVSRKAARLVPTSERATVGAPTFTPSEARFYRERARRAAQRRRRVLMLLLIATAVVGGLAGYRVFHWGYVAIPVALLVAWLVACRLMVKSEHRAAPARVSTTQPTERARVTLPADLPVAGARGAVAGGDVEDADLATDETGRIQAIDAPLLGETAAAAPADAADAGDRSLWDPVPMTLPTYVNKPAAARRTIRAIELDSTGVWTSGRLLRESELARQADEAAKEAKAAEPAELTDEQRAVGS